ncbi:MAG: MBOAT family protein [Anaerolineaceae bacterium]
MTFLSIEFAVFLFVLLLLLFAIKDQAVRKYILLAGNCLFYAWWDWRLFFVLAIAAVLNYFLGWFIERSNKNQKRRTLFWLSIGFNLLVLGYFKYANFFLDSLEALTGGFGLKFGVLNILAPMGISFITFETLSYLIDIYKGAIKPAGSLLDYAVFISFFPRIASGPIIRARNFLPQLEKSIHIEPENLFAGIQIFMRGLLKKVVVADNTAIIVDRIYTSPSLFSSGTVWLGVLAYSIQILCDFSGYTDMAAGIARILGFTLPVNFNLPYTAQSITEFWQRWHITLSTWFRDYLFYPLERARRGKGKAYPYLNLLLTMLVCGLWHGANWNFIVWGGLLGLYLVIERLFFNNRMTPTPWSSPAAWLRATWIFILVSLTWIPFRSPDWSSTLIILQKLLFFSFPYGFDWFYIGAVIFVPLTFIGGLIASRFKLEWPLLPMNNPSSVAFISLEILIAYYFSQLYLSPFIYSQF